MLHTLCTTNDQETGIYTRFNGLVICDFIPCDHTSAASVAKKIFNGSGLLISEEIACYYSIHVQCTEKHVASLRRTLMDSAEC